MPLMEARRLRYGGLMRDSLVRRMSLVGIALAAGGVLIGCGSSAGGPLHAESATGAPGTEEAAPGDGLLHLSPESARYIGTEPVATNQDPLPLRLPARLEFRDGAVSEVGAPMAGRIMSVRVRSGDKVRVGDPLLIVSCPDAAAARTGQATAEAALGEARAALERQQRMFDEGVGVARDRLEAEVRLTEAEAEAERARATAALIGTGDGAEVTLRASIAGVVLGVKATPGAVVSPGGEVLVEVGDPESLWVVADVPERELPLVSEGGRAVFEEAALPEGLPGRVISVGAALSSGLRSAPVRIALDARPAGLRPGMFGWVRLQGMGGGPTLPVEAVLIKDGRTSVVYVAKDDRTFERREVVVGRSSGGRVPVVSGLSAGERVVVRGALLLDGSAEQLL